MKLSENNPLENNLEYPKSHKLYTFHLEESIQIFEEGMKLSKKCNEIIENAEKKITILLEKNGELKEESFTPEE